jgi:hypothetical protein
MAYVPCCTCSSRFVGSTTYTYVTWWNGEEKFNYRLRQCASCASSVRNEAASTADVRDQNGDWRSAAGEMLGGGAAAA